MIFFLGGLENRVPNVKVRLKYTVGKWTGSFICDVSVSILIANELMWLISWLALMKCSQTRAGDTAGYCVFMSSYVL